MQHSHPTRLHLQATRKVTGHGFGVEHPSTHSDRHLKSGQMRTHSLVSSVVMVLANVVGGTLLLAGIFLLPQLIASLIGH